MSILPDSEVKNIPAHKILSWYSDKYNSTSHINVLIVLGFCAIIQMLYLILEEIADGNAHQAGFTIHN